MKKVLMSFVFILFTFLAQTQESFSVDPTSQKVCIAEGEVGGYSNNDSMQPACEKKCSNMNGWKTGWWIHETWNEFPECPSWGWESSGVHTVCGCMICPKNTKPYDNKLCCPQGQTYSNGKCVCPPNESICGQICCTQGQICSNGQCSPCPTGTNICGNKCCPLGQICSNGQCSPCPTGTNICGKICCPQGQVCSNGKCSPCPANSPICGNSCCAMGQFCKDGVCQSCPTGLPACGNQCCPTGQTCNTSGQCVALLGCSDLKNECLNNGGVGAVCSNKLSPYPVYKQLSICPPRTNSCAELLGSIISANLCLQ